MHKTPPDLGVCQIAYEVRILEKRNLQPTGFVANIKVLFVQGGRHLWPRPYHLYPFFEKIRNHLRPKNISDP